MSFSFEHCYQTKTHYQEFNLNLSNSATLLVCFCLAGDTGIEPILRESKSRVLPLHQSPTYGSQLPANLHWLPFKTKSRIFKDRNCFSTAGMNSTSRWIKSQHPKTKKPSIFTSRVLVSILYSKSYLPKPPASLSIAYVNCGREPVQPLFTNGRCLFIDLDIQFFIVERIMS
jgi:hypothetical protein